MSKIFKKPKVNDVLSGPEAINEMPLRSVIEESQEPTNLEGGQKATMPEPIRPLCPRCKGDGIFHSNKTGVRALTSSEPLIDPSKKCPDCGGSGKV